MLVCGITMAASAQDAFDVLHLSQTELRGTSRYMSMAGAFGALGGDISVLNQNPGGIGVYRSSDVNITLSLDFNSSQAAGAAKVNQTKFLVNNIGYVGAMKINSDVMPNFNWGFSYNRMNSFHRRYTGGFNSLPTSLSNYIAGQLNADGIKSTDLVSTSTYNPYFDKPYAPWIGIVSYDIPTKDNGAADIITDNGDRLQGLYGDGTTGTAEFEVDESGHTDVYNISFGGNVANVMYWGLCAGIADLSFNSYHYYGESLDNAYVRNSSNWKTSTIVQGGADYGYVNRLNTKGTGYNFKMGVIFKPVNQLRIGLAFHTPTYFDMRDNYYVVSDMAAYDASGKMLYEGEKGSQVEDQQQRGVAYRYYTENAYAHPALVGTGYFQWCDQDMTGRGDGENYNCGLIDVTDRVKQYFKPSHTVRVGAEYRLTPNWSLRAGYSLKSSQAKAEIEENRLGVVTVSTDPAYQYDKKEQYITCGVGYK